MGKIVTARTVFYDRKQWDRMAKDLKSKHPMFKVMGANVFKKVVVLHDPTKPLTKESAPKGNGMFVSEGRLTDPKKRTINKLMEEGKGTDDNGLNNIAKEVNVSFVKVKEYIQSF